MKPELTRDYVLERLAAEKCPPLGAAASWIVSLHARWREEERRRRGDRMLFGIGGVILGASIAPLGPDIMTSVGLTSSQVVGIGILGAIAIGVAGLAREIWADFNVGRWRTGLGIVLMVAGGCAFWVLLAQQSYVAAMGCVIGPGIVAALLTKGCRPSKPPPSPSHP